jgi:hypothetical protein
MDHSTRTYSYVRVHTSCEYGPPQTPSPDEVTPQPGSLIPSGIHRSSVDDDGLATNRELPAWHLPAARPSPHKTKTRTHAPLASSHPAAQLLFPCVASHRLGGPLEKRPCVAQAVSEATKKETHWPQSKPPYRLFGEGGGPSPPLLDKRAHDAGREGVAFFVYFTEEYVGVYATA